MKITGKVVVTAAERIQQLPAPFLSELDGLKRSLSKRGKKIIDLGRYDVNLSKSLMREPSHSSDAGLITKTLSEYLQREYQAEIDPEEEILLLPGSRIALLLIGAYFVDAATPCYYPDPGYDVYRNVISLFGGRGKSYLLHQRSDFLPNLDQFEIRSPKNMRLLFVNSPHNPTGASCDHGFFNRLRTVAASENILAIVDSSYALPYCGNFRPPLFCQVHRRLRAGLELISFSTTLCDPELKLTALIGGKNLIQPLAMLARSLGCLPDMAAIGSASRYFDSVENLSDQIATCRTTVNSRIKTIIDLLARAGIEYYHATSTGFVWVRLKRGRVSLNFARGLLRRKGIVVAPGSAFGEQGEGWVRIAANVDEAQLQQALEEFGRFFHPIASRLKRRES